MSKLQAILDWVIVKPIVEDHVGNIYIPTKKTPTSGEVISVGGNVKGLVVGNKVLYKRWESREIKFEKETYLVIAQKDVLGILD